MWNPIKAFQKWNIERQQADLDKEFELYGYSEELLEKQAKLNEKKYKLNIRFDDYVQ